MRIRLLLLLLLVLTVVAGIFFWENKEMLRKATVRMESVIKQRKCNVFEPDDVPDQFQSATLKFRSGNKAVCYVYNMSDLISKYILSEGIWEGAAVNALEPIFMRNPTLGLVDIGCNLGIYSIMAAMLRRRVVAVDANINNVKRLRKSLLANNLHNLVDVVYNGISNQ